MKSDISKLPATLFFLSASAVLLVLFFLPSDLAIWLTRERMAIEMWAELMYIFAAVYAILVALTVKGFMKFNFLFWLVLVLFFFGEETSYLQHWLRYNSPNWMLENNAQQELNVHNLAFLQGGSLRANGISLEVLLKSQNLFRIGFATYFLVLPLVAFASVRIRGVLQRFFIPYIGSRLLLATWASIALSIILSFIGGEPSALAEARESIYATTIALFLCACWKEVKPNRPGRSRSSSDLGGAKKSP